MHKKALSAMLRERRALITPESHGLARPTGQGRRAPGLSQQQVDLLLNRAIHTYHRLESGTYHNPPVGLLREVAQLFGFDEQEWVSLCRYARDEDPPGPLRPSAGKEIAGMWQEAVEGILHPAYITDASWDMLACNSPFTEMLPEGRVPANMMRYMLLSPDGRAILSDWETAWAPLLVPQLRAALVARPTDPVLREIEREVLADPLAAPLYEAGGAVIHPDGDERPIRHVKLGPGWLRMCAAQPLASPGARLIILMYQQGPRHREAPVIRSAGA
jgi:MmyB-like transcription regulator ligand binding domain/Helix-turn-helix domain